MSVQADAFFKIMTEPSLASYRSKDGFGKMKYRVNLQKYRKGSYQLSFISD